MIWRRSKCANLCSGIFSRLVVLTLRKFSSRSFTGHFKRFVGDQQCIADSWESNFCGQGEWVILVPTVVELWSYNFGLLTNLIGPGAFIQGTSAILRTLSSFVQTIAVLSKAIVFSRKCSCFWCWLWPSFSDQISSFPTEKTCIREKIFQLFSATTSKPQSVKFQCTYYFRIWTVGNLDVLKSG